MKTAKNIQNPYNYALGAEGRPFESGHPDQQN